MNVKMSTVVGILTFMNRQNFMLSCVEHGNFLQPRGLFFVNQLYITGLSLPINLGPSCKRDLDFFLLFWKGKSPYHRINTVFIVYTHAGRHF